jgi:hypothetical protein
LQTVGLLPQQAGNALANRGFTLPIENNT